MRDGALRRYNDRLTRFDRDLRVRYSPRRARFLLERRASYARLTIDPDLYGRAEHDTVQQLRDGYFELGSYPAAELPRVDRLIAYLQTQDVWHRGDQDLGKLAEAVADELDTDYTRREQATRDAALDDIGERAGEMYDHEVWQSGLRVVVPRSLPG
jgi:hypothetical protein